MPNEGDEEIQIECRVEHTTDKAWLVTDTMSGEQAWLPKSVGRIVEEVDREGNTLFAAKQWWCRKNKFI